MLRVLLVDDRRIGGCYRTLPLLLMEVAVVEIPVEAGRAVRVAVVGVGGGVYFYLRLLIGLLHQNPVLLRIMVLL